MRGYISMETAEFKVELSLAPRILFEERRIWHFYVYRVATDVEDEQGLDRWQEPDYHNQYTTRLTEKASLSCLTQACSKILVALESNGDGLTMKDLSQMHEGWFDENAERTESAEVSK